MHLRVMTTGKGAYGVVCSAKDTRTGEKVAIKKIQNAFEASPKKNKSKIELNRHVSRFMSGHLLDSAQLFLFQNSIILIKRNVLCLITEPDGCHPDFA